MLSFFTKKYSLSENTIYGVLKRCISIVFDIENNLLGFAQMNSMIVFTFEIQEVELLYLTET